MKKKTRELTELQQSFLDHLFGEAQGDPKKALKLAGYADSVKPREIVSSLKEEIIELAKLTMAMTAPRAAMRMGQVLEDGSVAGASNVLKAAQQILDRSGATAPSGDTLTIPSGGIFIMPAKERFDEENLKSTGDQASEDEEDWRGRRSRRYGQAGFPAQVPSSEVQI